MNAPARPAQEAGAPRGSFLPAAIALGTLVFFLAITWLLWRGASQVALDRLKATLKHEVDATTIRIERRMATYEQMLRGVRGLFASSGPVDRQRFHRYVAKLDIDRQFPGIQGIGYAPLVPAAQRDAHIASVRSEGEGFHGYGIRPERAREVYAPIVFMEPMTGDNLAVLGFDPYSAEVPRQAMDRARDLDRPIISAKLQLQQDARHRNAPGFVMYLPVYRSDPIPADASGRRAAIAGWVDAPFNMQALLAGLDDGRPKVIAYRIYDGVGATPQNLMFTSSGIAPQTISHQGRIAVGGRVWTLMAHPLPGSETWAEHELPGFVALAGVLLSLLMAGLAWLLASGRQRALAIARGMTIELRESESRLHAIIDNAAACIITIDERGRVESMNIAAQRIFGYEPGEVTGQNIRMLVPEPHRRQHDGYLSRYLETGLSRIIGQGREVNGQRKDGSLFPMELVVSEMSIHGRRAFTAIVRDISLRKQAQAALLARSHALARANSDLIRFAEVSAHHLVEPIRRIGSYAQRLRSRLQVLGQSAADEEVAVAIDTLEGEAARLRVLVRDIERYIAAGLPVDEPGMVAAERVLQSVQAQFCARLEAAGAQLQVAATLPAARIDARRLGAIFSVLIENALVHGQPLDPAQPTRIRICGERDEGLSRYRVQDNGPGIPAQYHERVFNIFERLGIADGGSGIGLAIARRIVEGRNGRIWIESVVGEGTTVVFELPDGMDE